MRVQIGMGPYIQFLALASCFFASNCWLGWRRENASVAAGLGLVASRAGIFSVTPGGASPGARDNFQKIERQVRTAKRERPRARQGHPPIFSDRPPPGADFDGCAAKERAPAVAPSPANNVLWLPTSIYSESANDCMALLFV